MDIEDEYDVIIIGAGVSGLCAAFQLCSKDKDLRVLVLEAKDRVGGRTCYGELRGINGLDTWDLGGQWIGNCQPHITALVKELGLETYSQYTTGKKLLQLSDNKICSYTGNIPAIPWYALIDLHLFITKVDRLVKDIDVEDPYTFPDAELWDSKTFEDVKKSMLWTNAARQVVDISGRCVFGTEASHISALYYLMYCAAAGGIRPLISAEPKIGGQELKIKGGAWKVCQSLMEKIGTEKVVLGQPVVQIKQDDDDVIIKTVGGQMYRCQRAILALPPHQQAMIECIPSLPPGRLNVLHRMPPGNITKVIVTYKTSFWRTAGLSGEAVTFGGSSIIEGLSHGPLCIVFDGTTFEGSPALVSFIGGKQQLEYSSLQAEDRKRAVLHSLSELFGKQALQPIDYVEKNWDEEPYNHGGPVSVATPGILTGITPGLRKPFGRLHFAGTESATVWCGFINGAVQSGYRAANEVLYNLRPQVITASDLEDTAYVKRRHVLKSTSHVTSLLHWFIALAIAGGVYYMMRTRTTRLPTFQVIWLK